MSEHQEPDRIDDDPDGPADGVDRRRAALEATVRTQADLEQLWRALMEPLGFSGHSVWWLLLDAGGRPLPAVLQIEEAEAPPDPVQQDQLVDFLRMLLHEVPDGSRIAFLRSRPGRGGPAADDRAWAAALYAAARAAGLPVEVVHFADDDTLGPIPWDALDRSA